MQDNAASLKNVAMFTLSCLWYKNFLFMVEKGPDGMVNLVPKYWLYVVGIRDGFDQNLDVIMSKTSVSSPSTSQPSPSLEWTRYETIVSCTQHVNTL